MKMFLFVDGADGVGKSTLVNNLYTFLQRRSKNVKVIQQPNGLGNLGFVRNFVKDKETKVPDNIRQLLHTVSHINDYITEFNEASKENGPIFRIFDRGPFSIFAYSTLFKIRTDEVDQMMKIHFETLNLIKKALVDLNIVFLNLVHSGGGFRSVSDGSYYEENIDFKDMHVVYEFCGKYFDLNTSFKHFWEVDVNGKTEEQILLEVDKLIQGNFS